MTRSMNISKKTGGLGPLKIPCLGSSLPTLGIGGEVPRVPHECTYEQHALNLALATRRITHAFSVHCWMPRNETGTNKKSAHISRSAISKVPSRIRIPSRRPGIYFERPPRPQKVHHTSESSENSGPHPIHLRKFTVSHANDHLFHLAVVSADSHRFRCAWCPQLLLDFTRHCLYGHQS